MSGNIHGGLKLQAPLCDAAQGLKAPEAGPLMWDFNVLNVIRSRSSVVVKFSYTTVHEEFFYMLEKTLILGTLYLPEGPREWSPVSPMPEGFEVLVKVNPDTRIGIKIDETIMADNMRSWKTGYVGFLDPGSPFWDYYKKRYGL